jgi:hypothetical protein
MRYVSALLLMFLMAVLPVLPQDLQKAKPLNLAAATKAAAVSANHFGESRVATNVMSEQTSQKKFPLWAKVAIAGGGIAGAAFLIRSVSHSAPSVPAGRQIMVEGQP